MKILLSGEGGQGIQRMAEIIAESAYKENYNISYMPHFGFEMRMGISVAYIIIEKNNQIIDPKFLKADILAALTLRELPMTEDFVDNKTRIINAVQLDDYLKKHSINSHSLNMLVLGIIVKELNTTEVRLNAKRVKEEIKVQLSEKKYFIESNLKAFDLGLVTDNEVYSCPLKSLKKREFKPVINEDKNKKHIIFPNLCKGCELCIVRCPVKALSWHPSEVNFIKRPIPNVDINKCTACMTCENICPDVAIKILKKK